jgi:nucleoside phosphorylase
MAAKFEPKPDRHLRWKDFAIIATLDEEFSAVRRNMSVVTKRFNDIPFKHYDCALERQNRPPLAGLVFQPHDTGRVEASVLTTYLLSHFQFGIVVLCGVAGGLKQLHTGNPNGSQFRLGDVVFANAIIDIEFQKISSEGLEYRDRVFDVEHKLVELFKQFWEEKDVGMGGPLSLAINGVHQPQAHIGSVVSGSKIIASASDHESLGQFAVRDGMHSAPLAVEMEGIGTAVAMSRLGHRDRFFMIRAISDFANKEKSKDENIWRHKACYNAALIAVEFIKFLSIRLDWDKHRHQFRA